MTELCVIFVSKWTKIRLRASVNLKTLNLANLSLRVAQWKKIEDNLPRMRDCDIDVSLLVWQNVF